MHLDDLRGMTDRQTGVRAAETATFGGDDSLIADEHYLDITFPGSLERPLNGRGWSMVTAHDIKRDFHRSQVLIE
jgi:hypothetical protein